MKLYNFYLFFNLVWEPRSCPSLILPEIVEEGNQVQDSSFKLFFKNYKRVKLNNLKPSFFTKHLVLDPMSCPSWILSEKVGEGNRWKIELSDIYFFRFTKEWNSTIFISIFLHLVLDQMSCPSWIMSEKVGEGNKWKIRWILCRKTG